MIAVMVGDVLFESFFSFLVLFVLYFFFFFQAEDGIRDLTVTGVQTCALPISTMGDPRRIDSLTAALSHTDAEVVKAALRALAGERDVRVAAHIGACLDHQAWDVRRLAADLLGRIGGETAIELLRAKLANESELLVKDAVHRALIEIEGGSAVRRTAPPPRPGSWPPR